jgi:glutamine synthetase
MTVDERHKRGIETLPPNLGEALKEMENDSIVKETLGDKAYNRFLTLKRREWFEYNVYVHEWERRKYLHL